MYSVMHLAATLLLKIFLPPQKKPTWSIHVPPRPSSHLHQLATTSSRAQHSPWESHRPQSDTHCNLLAPHPKLCKSMFQAGQEGQRRDNGDEGKSYSPVHSYQGVYELSEVEVQKSLFNTFEFLKIKSVFQSSKAFVSEQMVLGGSDSFLFSSKVGRFCS